MYGWKLQKQVLINNLPNGVFIKEINIFKKNFFFLPLHLLQQKKH